MRELGITAANADDRGASNAFSTSLVRVDNRARIQVYVQVMAIDDALLATIESVGNARIEVVNRELNLIQTRIPHDRLEAVATLGSVVRIKPPSYGLMRTGSVASEGDAIHNADDARSLPGGPTGSGVKVGVISDGWNGSATATGTGDLPATITTFGTSLPPPLGGEGTSMGEIIHDLAPDAELAIGGAFDPGNALSTLEFLVRVSDLKAWGADVIVDDVGFFLEPFFSDGPVATAYADALAMGVVMVSAAGNDAHLHYQGVYNNTGVGVWPNERHQFSPGDKTLGVRLPDQEAGIIVLQWSNPFGVFSMVPMGTLNDYDLCIGTGNVLSDCGELLNQWEGLADPVEALGLMCEAIGGSTFCEVDVKVIRFCGGGPDTDGDGISNSVPCPAGTTSEELEIFFVGNFEILENGEAGEPDYAIEADSVFGHPAVDGVISTAAINAGDPGNDDIAFYSSHGPSTICSSFPCTSPVLRATPAITGIDNVSVTLAGLGVSPFAGTSASAPHLAAIAALLLEADPTLTPAELLAALQSTAADRGAAGFDNTYGAGLADALAAVNLVVGGLIPPTNVSVSPSAGSGSQQVFTFTYQDAEGAGDIAFAQFNFSSVLSPSNACYVHYNPGADAFSLLNDDASGWLGPIAAGSAGVISNSQCIVNASGSGATQSGQELEVVADLTFLSGFVGLKGIHLFVGDQGGNRDGWDLLGNWTVEAASGLPELISLAPAAGSGATQVFTVTVRDGDGAADFAWVQLNMNATLNALNACYIHHDPTSNFFALLNDDATAWNGVTGGSGNMVANSQCTLRGAWFHFKYNIAELTTGVKPYAIEHLLEHHGINRIIYLDADIQVYNALHPVSRALEKSDILLTPHLLELIVDNKGPANSIFCVLEPIISVSSLCMTVARQDPLWIGGRINSQISVL